MKEYLQETRSINFSEDIIQEKIIELKKISEDEIDYIKNTYHFVRDEIKHSWDIRADVVSKTAGEVLKNGTGICWTKSCLLAALLRGNGIPAGISYEKLTRADEDASDGYIIHALNTVYVEKLNRWIRLDARGNKKNVQAQFSTEEELLAFAVRPHLGEVDYKNNDSDLDRRLIEILDSTDCVMNIRTDFNF